MNRFLLPAAMLALTGLAPMAMAQTAESSLTAADVQGVISRSIQEATARHRNAVITVVDRVGNVLAVYAMPGFPQSLTITSNRGMQPVGLEELTLATPGGPIAASITKAITGAYLSSAGNAFTTRTASQIIQENFNPGQMYQPGGPLFGVQFSQLACSDLNTRADSNAGGVIHPTLGPKRSPLGLAADPGGFPLYKNGEAVGGVGIEADGIYTLDRDVYDIETNDEELIAVAGAAEFDAPAAIRADRISAGGLTLRYDDRDVESLLTNPAAAPTTINTANLVTVRGYYSAAGGILNGTPFLDPASGYRLATAAEFPVSGAAILVNPDGSNRYPAIGGTDGPAALTVAEVSTLLTQAFLVASNTRAQIRQPLGGAAEVTIAVVDTNGVVLGLVRSQDAPIFGTDVALQKARTAMLFSGNYVSTLSAAGVTADAQRMAAFLGPASTPGVTAFSVNGIGNLARPFYPDGINGFGPGPLSASFNNWSPFATGTQLDLVIGNIVQHVNYIVSGSPDTPALCTPLGAQGSALIGNGIQIFPGGFPIFRNGQLVGGIGVSGDGVDQDDMVSFLGLHNATTLLNTGLGEAPPARRDDQLTPQDIRLRFASCPFAPFLNSSEQNPCSGF